MNFFESFRYVLFLVYLESYRCEHLGVDKCQIEGVEGECVPLPECRQLVTLLKDSSTTEEGLSISHDRRCGLDTNNIKVCCREGEKNSGNSITLKKGLKNIEDESDLIVDAFPCHDICGWTDINRTSRYIKKLTPYEIESGYQYVINNGIPVVSRDMSRYMALLGYLGADSIVLWNCGGSVITERHILTAAHCIRNNLYVVRVGELDLALEEKDAGPIDYYIKKKIRHEKYSRYHNDIGLIVIDSKMNFKEEQHVGPICLPHDSRKREIPKHWPYFGEQIGLIIAGWGEAPQTRARPTWLAWARVQVIEDSKCKKLYENENRTIDERVFCAGDSYREFDSCNGDSGGPIVAEYTVPEFNRTFFYQLGIISYGYSCSSSYFTGVYTNVTHFLPWIQEKVLGTKQ